MVDGGHVQTRDKAQLGPNCGQTHHTSISDQSKFIIVGDIGLSDGLDIFIFLSIIIIIIITIIINPVPLIALLQSIIRGWYRNQRSVSSG